MPNNSIGPASLGLPSHKEYLNYPSLILREVKSCKMLSDGAKHCWELLFDLSKFDQKRFIEISIKRIRHILAESKSYRTIQRYLAQLAKYGFITIKKNFDSYGRIENTYTIKIPELINTKIENRADKIFIKSTKLPSKPLNPRYDKFVQGNKELNIKDNNNCCFSDLEEKEEEYFEEEGAVSGDLPTEIKSDVAVLEYYPAKLQPSTPTKAVLRHALKHAVKFEATVNEKLTQAQESVVKQVISFWTALRYVSAPKECFDWIQAVLLNPQALSRCGNSFLKKMNVIFKMIREKRFSKPFAQRYREKTDYQKEQKPVKPKVQSCTELASMMSAISSSTSPDSRKTHQEQEKASRIDAFKTQIALVQAKIN